MLATITLGSSLLAQSSSSVASSPSVETEGADLFPSAEEVSDVFGVGLTLLGIGGGLSQAPEGSDFGSAPEAESDAIARLILDRLSVEPSAAP